MMRDYSGIEERFFQLLQIAVGKPINKQIEFTVNEWLSIYNLASEQSLVGLVLHAVDELVNEGHTPPQPLLLQWIGESEIIRQRNNQFDQLCRQLTSWFRSKGYGSCILKGQGAARLYKKPDTRQPGDIDIWVNAETDEIVEKMRNDGLDVTYVDYVNCHASFFTDTDVEVHFRPTYMFNPFVNQRVQRWIRENKDAQFSNYDESLGFSYSTLGFNLVFSLIHIYRHVFLEGIGLRQLTDYYYILSRSTESERKEAYKTLDSFGLRKFVATVMFVMRRVFNIEEELLLCAPNQAEGAFLLKEIMRGGNFGHYDDRNVYVSNEKRVQKGLNNLKRNFRYIKAYPSEVVWMPAWKIWHWCWRKWKGYL